MERVFLDANVLFSAAYKPNARLLAFWKLPDISLWTSRYALEEARVNLPSEDQQRRLMKLAEALRFSEATDRELPLRIRLPDKDVPILQAAIEAGSDYLVTGDTRHFGPYFGKKMGGVEIVRPSTYLKGK